MTNSCNNCKFGYQFLIEKACCRLNYVMCTEHKKAIINSNNHICQDHAKGKCKLMHKDVTALFSQPIDYTLHRKNEELSRERCTKKARSIGSFGS
jgi:hypothetical protein